ncbi:MAG: hypothetical protein L0956_07420, partial [Candidatus Mariimomonas ferrooxydans]
MELPKFRDTSSWPSSNSVINAEVVSGFLYPVPSPSKIFHVELFTPKAPTTRSASRTSPPSPHYLNHHSQRALHTTSTITH